MKKNMLTIVAIALSLVNVILTAVLVFSVVPAMNATNTLVSNVASIIDLELESNTASANKVVMSDMDVVTFDTPLTINLKGTEGDNTDHFAVIDKISVYLNKTADDYKALSENVKNYETAIDEMVTNGFNQYTKEEVQNNREVIKAGILKSIQEKFGTQTIADISFKNLRLQ